MSTTVWRDMATVIYLSKRRTTQQQQRKSKWKIFIFINNVVSAFTWWIRIEIQNQQHRHEGDDAKTKRWKPQTIQDKKKKPELVVRTVTTYIHIFFFFWLYELINVAVVVVVVGCCCCCGPTLMAKKRWMNKI